MSTSTLWTEAADKKLQSSLRAWTEDLEKKGKDAIQARLPEKILALNEILADFHDPPIATKELPLASSASVPEPESSGAEPTGRKKRKVVNGKEASARASPGTVELPLGAHNPGHVEANARVNAYYTFLRHHWEELIGITNDIKIYINLLVPKIEDGDTFGVQVQEECLSEISRAQDSGYNLLEAQFKHLMHRGKLASKLIKYPNLEDYQLALQEHDRKSVYLCRQHMVDLRNIYTLLTDLLHKNIVKITKPKGANSDGMY